MLKENNKVWYILALLFAVPFVIPMIIPDPYATIAIIGVMIASLFWLKSRMKGLAQSLIQSKMSWACAACGKPSNKSPCDRCGSNQRKLL